MPHQKTRLDRSFAGIVFFGLAGPLMAGFLFSASTVFDTMLTVNSRTDVSATLEMFFVGWAGFILYTSQVSVPTAALIGAIIGSISENVACRRNVIAFGFIGAFVWTFVTLCALLLVDWNGPVLMLLSNHQWGRLLNHFDPFGLASLFLTGFISTILSRRSLCRKEKDRH